ncbi:MAG: EamA family transporter [Spirochaetota bacterium]
MSSSVPVVLMILAAVALAVTGQVLVKQGMNALGTVQFSGGILSAYGRIFTSPLVLAGTVSYTVSILFWIYALSRVDLSFAYPFLALSYVLVIIASWLLLGERIPPLRWIGLAVICAGILLVSRSS